MKLKFDANLQFQLNAVNAVVDIFDGQPLNQSDFEISINDTYMDSDQPELGIGNRVVLTDDLMLKNIHAVQL